MKESERSPMTITRSILTFSPALPCVDCTMTPSTLTHIGVLYHQQAARTYQCLPLCPTHFAHEFLQWDQQKEVEREEAVAEKSVDNQDTEEQQA